MVRSWSMGWLIVLLGIVACSTSPRQARSEPGQPTGGDKYRIEVQAQPVRAGAKGKLKVVFHPAKGYKWNEQFHATFELAQTDAGAVRFAQQKFDRGAFKVEGKQGVLEVPFEARKAGRAKATATASFSMCNDETCLIFRDKKVEVSVAVE